MEFYFCPFESKYIITYPVCQTLYYIVEPFFIYLYMSTCVINIIKCVGLVEEIITKPMLVLRIILYWPT